MDKLQVFIVTGANSGIGREIAHQVKEIFSPVF